jgi:hypothetical protein
MRRTVAILGQNLEVKVKIALELANGCYPVVLQVDTEQEEKVKRRITGRRLNVSGITMEASSFACAWEADVIVIVGTQDMLPALAEEIEYYITGKNIVVFLNETELSAEVKNSFRYARNVFVCNADPCGSMNVKIPSHRPV